MGEEVRKHRKRGKVLRVLLVLIVLLVFFVRFGTPIEPRKGPAYQQKVGESRRSVTRLARLREGGEDRTVPVG